MGGKLETQAFSAKPRGKNVVNIILTQCAKISDIRLIRTDTTLDLSQKAETVMGRPKIGFPSWDFMCLKGMCSTGTTQDNMRSVNMRKGHYPLQRHVGPETAHPYC